MEKEKKQEEQLMINWNPHTQAETMIWFYVSCIYKCMYTLTTFWEEVGADHYVGPTQEIISLFLVVF